MSLDKMTSALLQDEGRGWRIDLFIDNNVKMEYKCDYCGNICKNAVELSCDVDHDDHSIQLYCEYCLKEVIASNNNNCPIDNHLNPTYTCARRIRGKINKAKVFCPNSAAYTQQAGNDKNIAKGNIMFNTSDEKEGMNANVYVNDNNSQSKGCEFNGNLCELIDHISKCCEANLDSKVIVKVLRNDINELKQNNKHIQNTLTIQNNVIEQLKTQNKNLLKQYTDILQKYEQQNLRINKLENIIKGQNNFNPMAEESKEEKERIEAIDLKILSKSDYKQLLEWLPNNQSNLTLLYRASRDGYDWKTYYNKIGNKAAIVCIIQTDKNYIFGGYTSVRFPKQFEDSKNYKDETAFIFLLRNKGTAECHKWQIEKNASYAVRICTYYGPIFGESHAFYVDGNMKSGYAEICKGFNINREISGESPYRVADVEAYCVQ